MEWFDRSFNKETAKEFFSECYSASTEFILNEYPDMIPHWPLSNALPANIYPFNPRGAVIHASESPSISNTLHLQTRHLHASHFIVSKTIRTPSKQRYPLLGALPSMVFMPYHIENSLPHSGFMSTRTWGIELRNAGRLRPVPKSMEPMPLLASEITPHNFSIKNPNLHSMRYYWRADLWRYPFFDDVFWYGDNCFELPSRNQIASLAVLLRVLDVYCDGLDWNYVIPSNCVSGSTPLLRSIDFALLRIMASYRTPFMFNPSRLQQSTPVDDNQVEFFDTFPKVDMEMNALEMQPVLDEDESLIGEQLENFRWRAEVNNGQLEVLDMEYDPMVKWPRELEALGYNTLSKEACNFSLALWKITHGLTNESDDMINNIMGRESPYINQQ